MREHHRELLIFASAATSCRSAAQDIVQEAFVSAWRSFERFDETRDFGAWMRGIVRNKTKDWFRKQNRETSFEPDFTDLEIDIATWQEARQDGVEIFEVVESCVGKLPANFKQAIRAFYFADQTSEEAATQLEISSSNLRKRLERARALLHDCIALQTHTQPQPDKVHV
ncbi:MAG: sigma-70 family RNA polymerase sigma factor [Verrucomicrobiota bacterium]